MNEIDKRNEPIQFIFNIKLSLASELFYQNFNPNKFMNIEKFESAF